MKQTKYSRSRIVMAVLFLTLPMTSVVRLSAPALERIPESRENAHSPQRDTPSAADWQARGEAHFRKGEIAESLTAFDAFLRMAPEQKPYHWQRGISLYYAGRFAEGKQQFELHQTVNSQDVENAVWHFLCTARAEGIEAAKKKLIPIEQDARVPMAQVHQLFAGKARPEDVLAAAQAAPQNTRAGEPLFYAHLYLGLYFEALGNETKAKEHILKAAENANANGYMGDVARVHAEIIKKRKSKAESLAKGNDPNSRFQNFDKDPGWDGYNNRSTRPKASVKQDFGYSRTAHAGRAVGEMGGFITPDALPAYYAQKIPTRTFQDTLSASGTLACTGREFNVLIGFFNAKTLNEWRTPNTIALRLYGRGDIFYAYVEYMTQKWRAGADSPGGFATIRDPQSGREQFQGFASNGKVHTWSLKYDPSGNKGSGSITVTIGSQTAICHLDAGHKADGAVFNRFGLLNVVKHVDGGGEIWLDDVTVNGKTEHFTKDPKWDQSHNRYTYLSENVRPRFDFGYSPTHYAKGAAKGELGGLVFRGDNRETNRMAYYGDRLTPMNLDKPLKASGKVSLRRAVSDSTTLIGFFHSSDSIELSASQANSLPNGFVGIAVEGPSRDGFLFYPVYKIKGEGRVNYTALGTPTIYPDGSAHNWTLEYVPTAAGGKVTITLDGKSVSLDVEASHKAGSRFDRFGIITTWIDGNGQQIYFDDLHYTHKQE